MEKKQIILEMSSEQLDMLIELLSKEHDRCFGEHIIARHNGDKEKSNEIAERFMTVGEILSSLEEEKERM